MKTIFRCLSVKLFESGNQEAHLITAPLDDQESDDLGRYIISGIKIHVEATAAASGYFNPGDKYTLIMEKINNP